MAQSDDLTRFVRDALSLGRPREEVEATLRSAGWPEEQTRAALLRFADVDYPVPVPRPAPYLSAKEAFWYLVLFTTLYLWAYHLGSLLFSFIELALPDPAESGFAEGRRVESIRMSVAVLLVAFPVFAFMARLVSRAVGEDPSKRGSKVRKWLTYLTLFVAVCVLIGDVTALLYAFMDGALTLRVFLKVLVVAAIAGGGLAYYLLDLHRDEREEAAQA